MSYRKDLNLRKAEYVLFWVASWASFAGFAVSVFILVELIHPFLAIGSVRPYAWTGFVLAVGGTLTLVTLILIGGRRRKHENPVQPSTTKSHK